MSSERLQEIERRAERIKDLISDRTHPLKSLEPMIKEFFDTYQKGLSEKLHVVPTKAASVWDAALIEQDNDITHSHRRYGYRLIRAAFLHRGEANGTFQKLIDEIDSLSGEL